MNSSRGQLYRPTFKHALFALALILAVPAWAGSAVYTSDCDAVSLAGGPALSYNGEQIFIAPGPPSSGLLPTNDGTMTGIPAGDFEYTIEFDQDNTGQASSSGMYVGPTLTIAGVEYAVLYGWSAQNGTEVRAEYDDGSKSGPTVLFRMGEEEMLQQLKAVFGDTAPLTIVPRPFQLTFFREGNILAFRYRPSPNHPEFVKLAVANINLADLPAPLPGEGTDITGEAMTFGFKSNGHSVIIDEVRIDGATIPDVDQGPGCGGEGEGEGEGEGPEGYGEAWYTGERDSVKLEGQGILYTENGITFVGASSLTLPRGGGGTLSDIPPGDFEYYVENMQLTGQPTVPPAPDFFGISVRLGSAEYNLRYAALPAGPPGSPPNFVLRATRGLGGPSSIVISNIDGALPPTELRISRNGDTLTFSYDDGAKALQTLGSIDLSNPLGDGSVDDSAENAEFVLYPTVDGSIDNIFVKGDPMYYVNFSSFPPDSELPVGTAVGLAALLALLGGAGASTLRKRR